MSSADNAVICIQTSIFLKYIKEKKSPSYKPNLVLGNKSRLKSLISLFGILDFLVVILEPVF